MASQTPQQPEAPQAPGQRRRRRLRRTVVVSIALVLVAVIVVLVVGLPWWTAAPDTVRVTVTQHAANSGKPDIVTTIYDHTAHDAALAQRLQRDLAALPIIPRGDPVSCELFYPYDTYTLTWSRSGLVVEQASASTPVCDLWVEHTEIFHEATHLPRSDTIFVDMHTMLGAPLPPCFRTPTCRPGA